LLNSYLGQKHDESIQNLAAAKIHICKIKSLTIMADNI